jgi:hypothetical protein
MMQDPDHRHCQSRRHRAHPCRFAFFDSGDLIPMTYCSCAERNNPHGGGASPCRRPCDFYLPALYAVGDFVDVP